MKSSLLRRYSDTDPRRGQLRALPSPLRLKASRTCDGCLNVHSQGWACLTSWLIAEGRTVPTWLPGGHASMLAERTADEPTHMRYKRMEAAWRALAIEQDWLDGEAQSGHKL